MRKVSWKIWKWYSGILYNSDRHLWTQKNLFFHFQDFAIRSHGKMKKFAAWKKSKKSRLWNRKWSFFGHLKAKLSQWETKIVVEMNEVNEDSSICQKKGVRFRSIRFCFTALTTTSMKVPFFPIFLRDESSDCNGTSFDVNSSQRLNMWTRYARTSFVFLLTYFRTSNFDRLWVVVGGNASGLLQNFFTLVGSLEC